MKQVELLAPARDIDAGIAAVNCGADAVYIGARQFGARENAGNSVQDIERLAHYAHKYWARVYVTLNTLLYDHELPEAVALITQLYEAGIDGLIIQDMGLLECDLPPLPLIASTQMHNNTPQKVAFLEQVGIQRVILARELSLDQIREIRRQTSVIELECFVHGALCVCYSGQCYLSYAIGGRSGNRGQCAQPCRKKYTLKDRDGQILSHNRYLLSLKDMHRADYLRELLDAGITSFKIEGRLKDEAYVKNIVSYYRQRLDAVLAGGDWRKSSSGTSRINFTPDPVKTFNRGYTNYFLTGRRDEAVASIDTPKSIGEKIGQVLTVNKRYFMLDTPAILHNGDGICFFDTSRELQGTQINSVQAERIFPASMEGISRGMVIYRNYDHAFITQLSNSRIERKIGVRLIFCETPYGFFVSAIDEDSNQVGHELACEKAPARNKEQAMNSLRKQLTKFGATEFECTNLEIKLSEPYFLPVAQLNALRREVLEKLTTLRAQQRPRIQGSILKNSVPYPERALSYLGNVLNQQAEALYLRHGVTRIEPAAESGLDLHGKKVMTSKYCLRQQLGLCAQNSTIAANFTEPLSLVDEHGQKYLLRFDCETCVMEIFFAPARL
ncbi:peptidase U32 family protein [Candidatus Vecturithrix granuli]|uniref:Peptidase U32 family protein n=1 Tax=Vecturithrix granuli TaxID=1499967 RepID=A0A081C228_VECG1|nr:peptidase U32 family protein [Candidatus Vecturithrix granuli]